MYVYVCIYVCKDNVITPLFIAYIHIFSVLSTFDGARLLRKLIRSAIAAIDSLYLFMWE